MKLTGLEKVAPTETIRRELRSLERESDPELYFQGLLGLGSRLAQRGEIQAAHRLFQIVQTESREAFPDLAGRAGREIDAIEGRGSFGQRAEFLSRGLFHEAASPSALIGMAGAQAAFGLARAAFFFRLSASPAATFWTRGFGARALASTGAFAIEAPSFVAFTRGAKAALGEKQDWSPRALGQEFGASILTLGALKLGAWAGGARKGLVQASTLGGILLGHRLEELVGLRAPTDGFSALTEGLATLLQFHISGRLLGAALGPRWEGFNRELQLRGQGKGEGPGLGDSWGWRKWAPASGIESPQNPHLLWMESRGSGSANLKAELLRGAPASIKELIEKSKATGKITDESSFTYFVEELLSKEYGPLTAEKKKFLLHAANRLLDEFEKGGSDHSYYPAMRIYWALEDFRGMRRLVRLLEPENGYRRETLMKLEDFEEAFRSFDIDIKKNYRSMPHHNVVFDGFRDKIFKRLKEFSHRRGYRNPVTHSLDPTAVNLTRLAPSYDLVIAIAKGGLFSGAMAEFLGLPVRVIEVHAHYRKNPTAQFIDEIKPGDVAGKRILFVDKDMVTGASIHEALRLIKPFQPKAVGVYFNHGLGEMAHPSAVQSLRDRGVEVHFPNTVEPVPTLPLFYYAHEKLDTALGRFRKARRNLEALLGEEAVGAYLARQQKAFFAFNPAVPGVEAIRLLMATRLEALVRTYSEARSFSETLAREHLLTLLKADPALPRDYAAELANARYHSQGIEISESHGVRNIHRPHSYLAAFRSAQRAVKDAYDFALIVGPEGFAYEPIFQDLGLKTLAVNIPEADFGGKRSIAVYDDLSQLKGKRVLVIEDDVQSGATLQKLWREIQLYEPGYLGLYLGLPAMRQMPENIPPVFKKVYVTDHYRESDDAVFLKHLRKRVTLFKDRNPGRKP